MIAEKFIDDTIVRMFENITFPHEPKGLYDPLRYMISIGGKRLRPRLCLTSYALFKDGFDEGILSPAEALEVFHTFTLIHDDIMDKSPLRRGMPTVWTRWNDDTAILSGDVMQIDAYKRLARAPQAVLEKVLNLFSDTAAQVCEGQQLDMDFERTESVPMADYEKMIGLKTAVLLACSAKMGALIAGAPEDMCDSMYEYGYRLGMAFQIADDYLDAYGDEKIFGKPIGGDILNGKKSWLTVRAMEKCGDGKAFLKAFGAVPSGREEEMAKIESIKGYYDTLGVPEDAVNEIKRYSADALSASAAMNLGPVRQEALRRFAEKLIGRVK